VPYDFSDLGFHSSYILHESGLSGKKTRKVKSEIPVMNMDENADIWNEAYSWMITDARRHVT